MNEFIYSKEGPPFRVTHGDCPDSFWVDPCTEENTSRVEKEGRIILVTKCPFCEKEDKDV